MAVIDQQEQELAQEAVDGLYSAASLLDALEWLDRVVQRGEAVAQHAGRDSTTGADRLVFFLRSKLAGQLVSLGKTENDDFVLTVPEGEALDWWSTLTWHQARLDRRRSRLTLISASEAVSSEGVEYMRTPSIELIIPFSGKVLDCIDGDEHMLTGRHDVIDQQQPPRYRLRYSGADYIPVVDPMAGPSKATIAR